MAHEGRENPMARHLQAVHSSSLSTAAKSMLQPKRDTLVGRLGEEAKEKLALKHFKPISLEGDGTDQAFSGRIPMGKTMLPRLNFSGLSGEGSKILGDGALLKRRESQAPSLLNRPLVLEGKEASSASLKNTKSMSSIGDCSAKNPVGKLRPLGIVPPNALGSRALGKGRPFNTVAQNLIGGHGQNAAVCDAGAGCGL